MIGRSNLRKRRSFGPLRMVVSGIDWRESGKTLPSECDRFELDD